MSSKGNSLVFVPPNYGYIFFSDLPLGGRGGESCSEPKENPRFGALREDGEAGWIRLPVSSRRLDHDGGDALDHSGLCHNWQEERRHVFPAGKAYSAYLCPETSRRGLV